MTASSGALITFDYLLHVADVFRPAEPNVEQASFTSSEIKMKTQLRNYVTSAMLLLPAMVSLVALPSSAVAQPAAPEVRSLAVDADAGFEPGSRLRFRLVGTPRVQASVRIRGVRDNIALREIEPGVYVGRYTLKRMDRVAPIPTFAPC